MLSFQIRDAVVPDQRSGLLARRVKYVPVGGGYGALVIWASVPCYGPLCKPAPSELDAEVYLALPESWMDFPADVDADHLRPERTNWFRRF